jgi:flagellar biosynthesis protein FlhA
VALVFGGLAWYQWQNKLRGTPVAEEAPATPLAPPTPDDLLPVQQLALEIGADLIYLVADDARKDGVVTSPTPGGLMDRIQKARNQFATELGVVLPVVHLRDNMLLGNGEYRFFLREEVIGQGTLEKRRVLALDPGGASGKLKGIPTRDPVFGMDAYWIHENQESQARQQGYAIADLPTVLITHFTELMTTHAHELYDQAQLHKALERVAEKTPKLVEDLVPDVLPRSVVLRVFRNLLREGVSVRDAQTVLEALADFAHKTREPDVLTEFVRQRLARHITRRLADKDGKVAYVALGRNAEGTLLRGLQTAEGGAPNLVVDPDVAQQLFTQIKRLTEGHSGEKPAVVLAPPLVRGALRRMVERVLPRAVVVSSAELLPTVTLDRVGVVEVRATPAG